MLYVKHPRLGNRHVTEAEVRELEANGWTRFPRTKEAKALGPWPIVNAAPQDQPESGLGSGFPAPDGAAPDPSREELIAELETRGIKYDKRWGRAKLLEAFG